MKIDDRVTDPAPRLEDAQKCATLPALSARPNSLQDVADLAAKITRASGAALALVADSVVRGFRWGVHYTVDAGAHNAALTDAASRQGDEAAIRQYAPEAEALAERYGHVLYRAIAHRAWGVAHRLAGEYPEAQARLNQA